MIITNGKACIAKWRLAARNKRLLENFFSLFLSALEYKYYILNDEIGKQYRLLNRVMLKWKLFKTASQRHRDRVEQTCIASEFNRCRLTVNTFSIWKRVVRVPDNILGIVKKRELKCIRSVFLKWQDQMQYTSSLLKTFK